MNSLRSSLRLVAFCLCAGSSLLPLGLFAQETKGTNPPPVRSPADQKWAEIQAILAPPPVAGNRPAAAPDPQARDAARRAMAARFMRAADEARAFAEANPTHPKAAEARGLEAKSLLNAAMAGDNSREGRAMELVGQIRRDSSVPAKVRLEVASAAEILRLRQYAPDRKKFLAEHEQSARGLIAEFPGEAGGYESLVRQAESHPDDAEGRRIAEDLLKMPAPESAKEHARRFLDRQALVGQSLEQIALAALGTENAIAKAKGRAVVLYPWATWSPGSIAQIKNLAKFAPAGTAFIGLNLDADIEAAKARADADALPGDQIFDARGREGPLAQALKLSNTLHVFVIDSTGVIREVSAERGDLTKKFGAAR